MLNEVADFFSIGEIWLYCFKEEKFRREILVTSPFFWFKEEM